MKVPRIFNNMIDVCTEVSYSTVLLPVWRAGPQYNVGVHGGPHHHQYLYIIIRAKRCGSPILQHCYGRKIFGTSPIESHWVPLGPIACKTLEVKIFFWRVPFESQSGPNGSHFAALLWVRNLSTESHRASLGPTCSIA